MRYYGKRRQHTERYAAAFQRADSAGAHQETSDPLRALIALMRELPETAGRLEVARTLLLSRGRGAEELLAGALQAARAQLAEATALTGLVGQDAESPDRPTRPIATSGG